MVVKASSFRKQREIPCGQYLFNNQIFLSDCHWPNSAPHKMTSQLEKEQKHGWCFKTFFYINFKV